MNLFQQAELVKKNKIKNKKMELNEGQDTTKVRCYEMFAIEKGGSPSSKMMTVNSHHLATLSGIVYNTACDVLE